MTDKQSKSKKIKINEVTEPDSTESVAISPEENASEDEKQKSTGDPLTELKAELEKTKQEAKDAYDRYLRASAELENFKKRSAREMDDFRKYANESLIREMLSVIDNLERALASLNGDEKAEGSFIEGIHMTHGELVKVLEKFHVQPIEALGKPFDPAFHQAVMQEKTGESPAQTVLKEFQKGYLIHDRLLRPAMVVVAASAENGDDDTEIQQDDLSE